MIEIRPAVVEDVAAIADVFAASGESVSWPGIAGSPYVDHLVARARVRVAIADGELVGFAGAIDVGDPHVRFLTDLFVRPDRQDRGAGGALLAAALDDTTERLTFSSADPRALGMYIRAGMRPWWPLLYLTVPRSALEGIDREAEVVSESSDVETTAALSLAWTGMDRTRDFAYYASLPGGIGHLIRDASGRIDAVVWSTRRRSTDGRVLAHATFGPDADPLTTGQAALRVALGDHDELITQIPGPHPIVRGLLERGGRIDDRDTYCATKPGLLDPERIFPSPGFL